MSVMTTYAYDPNHACLEGLESEIFKLVSATSTPADWMEWLHVPLRQAAARGNFGLFMKLLEAGADGSGERRGRDGITLLDAAALGGNVELISAMLRAGARPDAEVLVSSRRRRSPLFIATACGHEEAALRLIAAGADVNFVDPVEKCSVLHEAAAGGLLELTEFLLTNGADLGARDEEDGCTPLHVAADEGFDGIVDTLLQRGADMDALDNDGCTPMMGASVRGHTSVVKALLVAGADPSIRSTKEGGLTALENAAERGHVDVIKAILGNGADINGQDDSGISALHLASEYNQEGAVDALVEAGAEVELQSDDGRTPFLVAAHRSSCRTMLALRRHGANLAARDIDLDTALHGACFWKYEGLEMAVDLLLRWGADETALNDLDQTPADMLNTWPEGFSYLSTDGEIERTRLLLSRAPVDRVWRRRGWLVMLRSRSENGGATDGCDSDGGVMDGSDAGGGQNGRDFETGVNAGGVLSGMVALLVKRGPEGVFRTVLAYL